MCLILVAWRSHAQFPCVLAANRDEFFARAARPAQWWAPAVIATADTGTLTLFGGRDEQAGGTWLGITPAGHWAALTNFRDPGSRRTAARSRGDIVPQLLALLRQSGSVQAGFDWLRRSAAQFNGFNVLFSDGSDLAIYESVPDRAAVLAPGLYGLSNHQLDTPWPKVRTSKSRLGDALVQLPDTAPLLSLLRDDQTAREDELPSTGLSPEWERLLSSAFIRAPGYGTRCSTVMTVSAANVVRFGEWTWDEDGNPAGAASVSFQTGTLPAETLPAEIFPPGATTSRPPYRG